MAELLEPLVERMSELVQADSAPARQGVLYAALNLAMSCCVRSSWSAQASGTVWLPTLFARQNKRSEHALTG